MIPLLLLGGLLFGAAAVVVVTFWDEIKQFLKIAYDKVKKLISAAIAGVAAYAQTGSFIDGIKVAYKFYSKDSTGKWQESVVTKTVNDNEVPEHIRRKLDQSAGPVDISNDLELQLS